MKVEDLSTVDVAGKVVVARIVDGEFFTSMQLARQLQEQGAALVLILGPNDSIDTMSEEDMARHGWVRRAPGPPGRPSVPGYDPKG